jgi:hypothetical protein
MLAVIAFLNLLAVSFTYAAVPSTLLVDNDTMTMQQTPSTTDNVGAMPNNNSTSTPATGSNSNSNTDNNGTQMPPDNTDMNADTATGDDDY